MNNRNHKLTAPAAPNPFRLEAVFLNSGDRKQIDMDLVVPWTSITELAPSVIDGKGGYCLALPGKSFLTFSASNAPLYGAGHSLITLYEESGSPLVSAALCWRQGASTGAWRRLRREFDRFGAGPSHALGLQVTEPQRPWLGVVFLPALYGLPKDSMSAVRRLTYAIGATVLVLGRGCSPALLLGPPEGARN